MSAIKATIISTISAIMQSYLSTNAITQLSTIWSTVKITFNSAIITAYKGSNNSTNYSTKLPTVITTF